MLPEGPTKEVVNYFAGPLDGSGSTVILQRFSRGLSIEEVTKDLKAMTDVFKVERINVVLTITDGHASSNELAGLSGTKGSAHFYDPTHNFKKCVYQMIEHAYFPKDKPQTSFDFALFSKICHNHKFLYAKDLNLKDKMDPAMALKWTEPVLLNKIKAVAQRPQQTELERERILEMVKFMQAQQAIFDIFVGESSSGRSVVEAAEKLQEQVLILEPFLHEQQQSSNG